MFGRIILIVLVATFLGWSLLTRTVDGAGRAQVYVVQPGDTLWSIARQVAPGRDPRPVVDGLIKANDVRGGLQAGQELSIPVPER
jgi:Tfp pilus assembly protein FimV